MSSFDSSLYTDRYIHFTSHHHPGIKSGTIRCLKHRMDIICDDVKKQEELSHIRKTFQNNGYPTSFITRTLMIRQHPHREESNEDTSTKLLCIRYCQDLSEPIQRICQHLGVSGQARRQKAGTALPPTHGTTNTE